MVQSLTSDAAQGKRVLTLALVDELHERPSGTAKRNFRENKDKLTEGRHYYEVPYEEWKDERTKFVHSSSAEHAGYKGPLILLTDRGYLMLVKSFRDEPAGSGDVS